MDKSNTDHLATAPMSMAGAIEVFARGFAFTRSQTHPCLAARVGPAWVVRDAPRKKGNYRNEEWIIYGVAPAKVDEFARANTRGGFAICALCAMDEPEESLRNDFKLLGYRLGKTEPLMIHPLVQIPQSDAPAQIKRVMTMDMAERLASATRSRPMQPAYFEFHSPLRQYVAQLDNELVGWVSSVVVGNATWCSHMYVSPAFRRRGIARALLCQMLHDDRVGGAQAAVLLASHTGAKLYAAVGYRQIGTLLFFTPRKS